MSDFDLHHALAVASRVDTLEAKLVALLHDAVEDGACTLSDLMDAKLPNEVLRAVDVLTRVVGDHYQDYIERIKNSGSPLAIYVKLADLEANLARMDADHASLSERYHKAHRSLSSLLG